MDALVLRDLGRSMLVTYLLSGGRDVNRGICYDGKLSGSVVYTCQLRVYVHSGGG